MKTSCLIRNILLAGTISLTLASCGGGGGGGSSSGKGSSAHKPSTQQGLAPYTLSGCTMTYTYNGKPYTFTFDDSGEVNGVWENGSFTTNYDGSYTYSRSADGGSASLNMYTTSGTNSQGFSDSQTFNIKLAFSSTTQATARVNYTNTESYNGNALPNDKELEYTTTATFSGSGVLDNGFSEGESNDDTTSDDSTQLAPESLSVGSVINLTSDSGSKSAYTLSSATNCISGSGSRLTWEYTCTGDATGDFVIHNALNIPSTYKLVFTSAIGGTYTYINAAGVATLSGSFTLSDKSESPSQDDSDDENEDDSGESNVELGTAPDSLRGYSIQLYESIQGLGHRFYFDTSFQVYCKIQYTDIYGRVYTNKQYGRVSEYTPSDDRKSAKVKFYLNDAYAGPSHFAGETVEATLVFDDYGDICRVSGFWKNSRGTFPIDAERSSGSKR